MIATIRPAGMRISRMFFDFLRHTPRLVALLGGILVVMLSSAAGAAEVKTFYAECGDSDSTAVRLEPGGIGRTNIIDARANPPAIIGTLLFPTTVDHIATHLGDIRETLRRGSILDCADRIRVSAHVRTIAYPQPANLSPAVDSPDARHQQHWKHAEVRYLQERGQGSVVTASDTRYTDPDWPLYAVGMVLFFSAGNGGDQDVAVIYAWNHETKQYDRVMEAPEITMANMDDPDIQERLLSYMGANVRVPASIPSSGSDPGLSVYVEETPFYRALDSGAGQCTGQNGMHDAIAQCYTDGNAILLGSHSAQAFDPYFGEKRVVGVVRLVGNDIGDVLVWVPDHTCPKQL